MQKQQHAQTLTYITFPHSDFTLDVRNFKSYKAKLFKTQRQKPKTIENAEVAQADNVLDHIVIVQSIIKLVQIHDDLKQ